MNMKLIWVGLLLLIAPLAWSQISPLNRQLFFVDDNLVEVTLTTDIKKLRTDKKIPVWQPANIVMKFGDSSEVHEVIRVQPRGEFRKENCDIASLMFDFKTPASPKLSPLKKLKFVGGCQVGKIAEDLLIREYLTYKIYSLISTMAFRVRLLHVKYNDSRQKVKPYAQYAFLIEDVKDLADRNNCVEIKNLSCPTEATNRAQMTIVNIFQYMIGNVDWSVPKCHNMKLIAPKNDTLAKPYPVPYDFDYAGIVDAAYAIPNEAFNIKSVRERLYRGFPRSLEEIQEALEIFKEKKSRMLFTINNCDQLPPRSKKSMVSYLEEFYELIERKQNVRSVFVTNARVK